MGFQSLVDSLRGIEAVECVGLGWGDIRDEAAFHQALRRHRVEAGTLVPSEQGFRARVRDGDLVSVASFASDEPDRLTPVSGAVPPYTVPDTPVRDLVRLAPGAPAHSTVGGVAPDPAFGVEAGTFASPFGFCAHLSRQDTAFAWLPFDLALAFPFTAELQDPPFIFDYADPQRPVVVGSLGHATRDPLGLAPDAAVVFEPQTLGRVDGGALWTRAGVPNWQQAPEPPRSPATGHVMDFVVQIDSLRLPRVPQPDDPRWWDAERDGPQFAFWSDGALYVFIEPETHLVAYVLQTS